MIVCPKCGKENQGHFRFCLGCGAEFPASESAESVGTATAPADAPKSLGMVSSASPAALPRPASLPIRQLGHTPAPAMISDNSASSSGVLCEQCGARNPPSFHFCGVCGQRLSSTASDRGEATGADGRSDRVRKAAEVARVELLARLSLIRPDGSPDGTHVLQAPEAIVGREAGPLFAQDLYLSPHHARFFREGRTLLIEDIGSLNGVFVRINAEQQLVDGDIFRIGQELLRFDAIGPPRLTEDGTQILGSPNPGYWGRLSLIVGEGVDGIAFPLMGEEMVLGRERGDILFSDDGYVSATHAKLLLKSDGTVILVDMGSSNGTFIRLRTPRKIALGTFILMGQQLFRVDPP